MDPTSISRSRTSASAIASLVCGLFGCIPFFTGLAAVILGIVGIRKTRDPMVTGRGMAITGLILGSLSLVGWAIGTVTIAGGIFAMFLAAEPARETAEQFTRDLSEGNVDAAVALSIESRDRASLVALSEKMKPWGTLRILEISTINIHQTKDKSEYSLAGEATFANATKSYTMTLNKVGELYKVVKFGFP